MKWLNLEDYLKHPGAPDTVGPSLITACGPYVMVERGLEQFYQVGGGKDFFSPNHSLFRNKKKGKCNEIVLWPEMSWTFIHSVSKLHKNHLKCSSSRGRDNRKGSVTLLGWNQKWNQTIRATEHHQIFGNWGGSDPSVGLLRFPSDKTLKHQNNSTLISTESGGHRSEEVS